MKLGYLQRHDDAKYVHRYYYITIVPNLFGNFVLIREWGRIGSTGGQRKEDGFPNEIASLEVGLKIRIQKRKKGYSQRTNSTSKSVAFAIGF